MDETTVYIEDNITQAVDVVGRTHVIVKSTGFSSMRITAVFGVWLMEDRPLLYQFIRGKEYGLTNI